MKITIRILFTAFICIILLSVLHTQKKLFLAEYLLYYIWFIPVVLIIEAIRFRYSPDQEENSTDVIPGLILFFFLLLALCSSWLHHKWFYFLEWQHAHIAGFHYLRAGIIQFIFITQLLIPVFLFLKRKTSLTGAVILVCLQIICIASFLMETRGHALYGDDHTSFMYRLWEFGKTFPRLTNYSPYWNGGAVSSSGTTTGAISLGILFWPLWRFFPVCEIYTHLLAILFIIIVPLLYVFSIKIINEDWTSAWCAGILTLGVSQYFFLWLFNYGTPGALLSSALLVPFASCLFRIFWLDKMELWLAVSLVLISFFLVLWPPGTIMALAVIPSVIISFPKWTKKKVLFIALCFIIFFVFYFKMLIIITSPDTLKLVSSGPDSIVNPLKSFLSLKTLCSGWRYLGAQIKEGHPLLVFFGIGGIFILPQRKIKYWFMPIIIAIAFLSGWSKELNPELELNRMAIPMFFISVVPASLWISKLLKTQGIRFILVKSALISLLVLGGWNSAKMYGNRGLAKYATTPQEIDGLTKWLKKNVPEDARILLAGLTMHGYGHGHVAILPYLAKREMLAADYFHYNPKIMQPHLPPPMFTQTKEDLFKYMELYNITHIVAQDEEWKNTFSLYPDQYKKQTAIDNKIVFSVNRNSTMFLKGSGTLNADFNLIKVSPNNHPEDIVIKYNWHEGLLALNASQIFPFDAGYGIKFIGIKPQGKKEIVIRYKR